MGIKPSTISLDRSFLGTEELWCKFTIDFIVVPKFGKLSISLGLTVCLRKDWNLQWSRKKNKPSPHPNSDFNRNPTVLSVSMCISVLTIFLKKHMQNKLTWLEIYSDYSLYCNTKVIVKIFLHTFMRRF